MKVHSVLCNHCGAPLDIKPRTRYLSCAYCGTHLTVSRSGNALYTEILEEVQEETRALRRDIDKLKMHQELEDLDTQWKIQRKHYRVKQKDGTYRIPTKYDAMFGGGFMAVFGVIWIFATIQMGAPFFFSMFGVPFVAFSLFIGFRGMRQAEDYDKIRKAYEHKRKKIIEEYQEKT